MPAWMKSQEVAARIGMSEFITISTYLEETYGDVAKRFGVLEVVRAKTGELLDVKVILAGNNRIVHVNSRTVNKEFDRRKRELEQNNNVA